MRVLLTRPSRGRGLVALACALAALAAAVAAAIGPAVPDRATYDWPPPTLPASQPTRSWFAPLLLIARTPKSLHAHVPCTPGATLAGATDPVTVFATARHPARENALAITWARNPAETTIRVGTTVLARLPGTTVSARCGIDVHIDDRLWTIQQSGAITSGELTTRPTVNGLITQLDLHAKPDLRISVQPETQDTHPSTTQTILRFLAALLIATSLWLTLQPRRPTIRLTRPSFALPDAGVFLTLVTWWIVGPMYFDDGWVRARQTNALASGGFSNYYDGYGANLPLGTWLEWLQQFLVAHTSALVVQRIPSVICLAAVWLVCRAALTRLIGASPRKGDAAWWTAALTFSVGAAALGITLRPEPMIALLGAGTLACAIRFAARPALAPLTMAVLLVGLAVTEHPAGLAVAAPLIVCLPAIIREARSRCAFGLPDVVVVAICGGAWAILLAFLDSDLTQRRADALQIRSVEGGHTLGPLDEWQRYRQLWQIGAPPLRREFVAVCLLCVVAFLLNRWRQRPLQKQLPAAALGLGLVLLAFAPSKWIWHFGGFIGTATIAAGTEAACLRARGSLTGRGSTIVAGSVVLATATAAIGAFAWGPIDIRSFAWPSVPFELAVAAPVLIALTAGVIAQRSQIAWHPALWYLPVALASLLLITTAAFVTDAAATSEWSAARQALTNLAGRDTCGLADNILVPDPASLRPLSRLTGANGMMNSIRPLRGATIAGVGASAWYGLESDRVGIYVGGTWRRDESLDVIWGRRSGYRVTRIAEGKANLAEAVIRGTEPAPWRFVARRSLPPRPATATAVRFVLRSTRDQSSHALVTSPIAYRAVSLAELIGERGRLTLASPFIFASLPCARLPDVALGVGAPPTLLVDWAYPPAMTFPTASYGGIPDIYDLRRLPLADSAMFQGRVTVHTVAVDPRDALAAATRTAT